MKNSYMTMSLHLSNSTYALSYHMLEQVTHVNPSDNPARLTIPPLSEQSHNDSVKQQQVFSDSGDPHSTLRLMGPKAAAWDTPSRPFEPSVRTCKKPCAATMLLFVAGGSRASKSIEVGFEALLLSLIHI